MKTKLEERSEYKLPADTPFTGILREIKEKSYPFTNRDGEPDTFTKWTWIFEITEGQFEGERAYIDTRPEFSTHPDNKVRQFAEVLLGREFGVGEDLDTDDLLGLPCIFTVLNFKEPKKDNPAEFYYRCPVDQLFPNQDSEPPW